MQNDITVDGAIVRRGNFVTYQVADAHLNPEIYPDPLRFDPERFVHGREEDQREAFGFVGWGAGEYLISFCLCLCSKKVHVGRHPCVGMRAAKLEIKLLLGLILLGYEYELVDESGNHPKELPIPDKNDNHQAGCICLSVVCFNSCWFAGAAPRRTILLGPHACRRLDRIFSALRVKR